MNAQLTNQRDIVLNKISQNFDFGEDVVVRDIDGWQYQTPGKHYSCYVYIDGDTQSIRLTLNVIFENNDSAVVQEVYASTPQGCDIGTIAQKYYA